MMMLRKPLTVLAVSALMLISASSFAANPSPDALLGKKETAPAAALPTVAQPTEMDPKTNARLVEIARALRCLVCQNESIADSQTEAAKELRAEAAALIAAGKSDSEVIDTMVERYGEFVLYNPLFKANTWLLWLAPLGFFLLALFFIGRGARQRLPLAEETPAERERIDTALAMLEGRIPFDAQALKEPRTSKGEN